MRTSSRNAPREVYSRLERQRRQSYLYVLEIADMFQIPPSLLVQQPKYHPPLVDEFEKHCELLAQTRERYSGNFS